MVSEFFEFDIIIVLDYMLENMLDFCIEDYVCEYLFVYVDSELLDFEFYMCCYYFDYGVVEEWLVKFVFVENW